MALYALFAHGTYYGSWTADSDEAAIRMQAADIGADADAPIDWDTWTIYEVTPDQARALDKWAALSGDWDECPLDEQTGLSLDCEYPDDRDTDEVAEARALAAAKAALTAAGVINHRWAEAEYIYTTEQRDEAARRLTGWGLAWHLAEQAACAALASDLPGATCTISAR